jgi:hypothetical protein
MQSARFSFLLSTLSSLTNYDENPTRSHEVSPAVSPFFTNRRSICKRFPLAVAAAVCLLLTACDQTGSDTVRRQDAAPVTSEKARAVAVAPPVVRPVAPVRPAVASSAPAQKSSEPARQAPDQHSPVTATLRTDKNAVRVGESFTVTVDVQIAPGWHIYAIDRPTGLALPTKIRLELPGGLESAGAWTSPEPALDDSSAGEPAFVYHGTASFQQTIRVKQRAPAGPMVIPLEFRYQVCDRFSCRAPADLKLQTEIRVVP